MIDEKKIDEWAKKYANVYSSEYPEVYSFHDGFVKGIDWYKQNLWHDVSEMPQKAKAFIFECGDNSMNYHVGMMFNPNDYKKNAETWHMNKWCYLSDILPKKGGE